MCITIVLFDKLVIMIVNQFCYFLLLLLCSICFGANVPISFHDIVVVEPSGEAVIRLKGYDLDGDKVC